MKFEKIHNKGQAQIFQNPYLELLTKTNPFIIWGMYTPVIIGLPYYSINNTGMKPSLALGVLFAGMFFWTFFEYIAHRFIFHWIAENEKTKRIVYVLHGNHHEYPRDRERLFMPPIPSLFISSLIFGLMFLLMSRYAFVFFPGFIFGYLLYASIHYAIHAWPPPFKWMKPLWRNHHLHHYKHEEKGFGVSTTFWDRLFGTMFDLQKEKEDKEKVNGLMFEKR
jgi:sterol desaturase/sphingolipid hydroxylase (fatty acid hydroxylase superfamily)